MLRVPLPTEIATLSDVGSIYVTGFAKTGLITDGRNCSYSTFLLAKSILVDFLFS